MRQDKTCKLELTKSIYVDFKAYSISGIKGQIMESSGGLPIHRQS